MTETDRYRLAWQNFVQTGAIDTTVVRSAIAASWLRCRQRGMDPCGAVGGLVVTGRELERILAENREFITVATPFMQDLRKLVASSGFIVTLADRYGYLIEVIGDNELLESERGLNFVPGIKWTEESVGTTAISLALQEQEPVQIVGYEHYCQEHHGWACSAAPLRDWRGRIIGVLNVTGPKEQVHCHTLGMVVAAAAAISNLLQVRHAQAEHEKAAKLHATIVNSISDGLLTLDRDGLVTFINPTGARILQVDGTTAMGKHISSLVDFRPVVLTVLETGHGYVDKEFFIETRRGLLHFVKTAIPLKNQDGQLEGVIDIFREIKKVRRLVNHMVGATARFNFEDIIGDSASLQECVRLAKIAANRTSTVLLQGESGTGKELFAQAIHNASSRADGPFVAINCGALPRNLVESELFGYDDGAFTGAKQGGRPGKFELAQGGTIFLDEVAEMPLDIQVKLLRVLQEKRLSRVGGQRYLDIDVRIIAATNRDLLREVQEGNFRRDLYYRLNVLPLVIPPLRERREDIAALARFFVQKMCDALGLAPKQFSPVAMLLLVQYDWPGNVRELENIIERAVNICEEAVIEPQYLPSALLRHQERRRTGDGQIPMSLRDMERQAIAQALHKTRGNMSSAARLLGIGRNTLYSKVREYNITIPRECVPDTHVPVQ